jgi:arylsulfatase A-like enzyme
VNSLVINADLAPTLVDLSNAKPGRAMDGRSLIPVAKNPALERGRKLLIEEPRFKAIRTQRYLYSERASGEKELYDLREDPYELRSRHNSPAYASVRKQLASTLARLRTCAGQSCHVNSAP